MPRIVIELPENLKTLVEPLRALVKEAARVCREAGGGKAVPYAAVERLLAERAAEVERAAHAGVLASLDVDSEQIRVAGNLYRRVGRYPQTYKTLAGPVTVERSLYRQLGCRNGKTVDAVTLRTGALPDGWLPQTARAMSLLMAQGTSREAEIAGRELGRLVYSHSSFERVAHMVGEVLVGMQADVEAVLREELAVDAAARSISVSLDRVSVPMEEPRPRPVGCPQKNAPKRPCERVFRMAWCATLTLHDKDGEAIRTLRYGRMPAGDAAKLCAGVLADAQALLAKKRRLDVVLLADGAAELWTLLDAAFNEASLGKPVHRLIDAWHLLEKLGAAARVIHRDEAVASEQVRHWRMRLMNGSGAAKEILAALRESGKEQARVGKQRPVHEAITYLENNGDRMDYATARRGGQPIGSGAVEATCIFHLIRI